MRCMRTRVEIRAESPLSLCSSLDFDFLAVSSTDLRDSRGPKMSVGVLIEKGNDRVDYSEY